jgi:hypothetical protein
LSKMSTFRGTFHLRLAQVTRPDRLASTKRFTQAELDSGRERCQPPET